MASNNVITDIESKTKATSSLNLSGVIFVIIYLGIAFMLKDYIHAYMIIPYFAFSTVAAIFLVLPSRTNKGRNNLESIFVLLTKDTAVYRPYISKEQGSDG